VLSVGDPPNVGEGGSAVIVVGIDAHKHTETAAIVEQATGRVVADVAVAGGDEGHALLLDLAHRKGVERVWAIEVCPRALGE
jgi:hypothetical protein